MNIKSENCNSVDTSNTEVNNVFIDMILEFSQLAVLDHMESLYNIYPKYINSNFFSIATYKPIILSLVNYYNLVFKSLILKNDTELSEIFKKITSFHNHKEICLINIMLQLSISFLHHIMGNHHKFNKETSIDYTRDICDCIIKSTDEIRNILIKNIKHECNGQGLDECDPDKPLFSIKDSNIYQIKNMDQ